MRGLLAALVALALPAGAAAQTPTATPSPTLTPAPSAIPPPAAPRPNIVFVLTDDLSSDLVRFMPEVRQLRRDGVSFDRYFVSNSLCCPSRATIFTGRLPHNTLVRTNLPPFGGYAGFMNAGNAFSTFGTSLSEGGYRTGLHGKFMNGYLTSLNPPLPGFADWQAGAAGYRQYDYALNVNGQTRRFGHRRSEYLNDVLARRAAGFMQDATDAGTPFMLEISSFTPHSPYVPADRDRGKFPNLRAPRGPAYDVLNANAPAWLGDRRPLRSTQRERLDRIYRKRAVSVLAVDRILRIVRRKLDALGIAENTYVIFSSDNGFHVGEHRLLPGKQTAFDHDVKVPLIVAGPGVPRGQRTGVIGQNQDLRPTFEAMAGLPEAPDVDGYSLLPWMRDPALGGGRAAALIEHKKEAPKPFADPDAQTREEGNPPDYTALRLPAATYVEYVTGEREYYDLRADPHQLENVYGALPAATREALAAQLAALRTCRAATCRG